MIKRRRKMNKLLSVCLCLVSISCVRADNAVAFTRPLGSELDWGQPFCIDYNPHFHDLPATKNHVTPKKLTDLSKSLGCNGTIYDSHDTNDSVVLVARGNCTFSTKAELAQSHGAAGVLVASYELLSPGATNVTKDYQDINITVATLLWKQAKEIRKWTEVKVGLEILMYAPTPDNKFDLNFIVIFLIAVSSIVIGGYWAGTSRHAKYQRLRYKRREKNKTVEDGASDDGHDDADDDNDADDDTVDISLPAIIVFFVLTCGFLVLLYFFFDYLVYVIIVLFCLAGAMGLYACLLPAWRRIFPFKARFPPNRVPLFRSRPEYRSLLLLLLCLSVGIWWGVKRHASYSWVVQDILGFVFCLNVMKTVCVPNLKVCTILLCLLFVYDVFFVFITPYFTSSGESVMVKVATGGDSTTHEQLPMVFKVPRLTTDDISVCPIPFSLLGFGDIIIPGLLVAHNHAFDMKVQSRRVYFIATAIAYAVGLVMTFVALAIMKTGQPALLYLVPCILITTILIGLKRKEVKLLWSGFKEKTNGGNPGDVQENNRSVTYSDNVSSSSGTDNESRDLLQA